MSRTIDSRVVEMQFDNKQFESNVKTSMSTLDKLKQSLNLTGASKGLENVGAAAKNVNMSGLSGAVETVRMKFSALEVMAVTALANITTWAMRAGSSLLKNTIGAITEGGRRRALNIEQAKFQFKGLGMDVEATMADASYAVDGTAYSLDAAAKVASQLGASGMRAGDDMRKSLRAVSGVAAMAGSSYEDIGNVFTKVAGQGRLMGDDLLRLSSRGINAAATIAKELNKTEAEVRDMVTKGKIDFQMFADAMDSAFGEHATAANETYTGALSNVKAALARIGEKIYGPLHENMIAPLNELRLKINEVAKILEPTFTKLATLMEKAGKKATEMLKNLDLTETINKIKIGDETSDKLRRTFAGLFAVLDLVRQGIGFVLNVAGELFSLFGAPAADGILGVTASLGDLLVKLNESVKEGDVFKRAFETLREVFVTVAEKITDAINRIKEAFATVAEKITDAINRIKEAFGGFKSIDTDPLDKFSERSEKSLRPFTRLCEIFGAAFEAIVKVLEWAAPIVAKLGSIIGKGIGSLADKVTYAVDNMEFNEILDLINTGLFGAILYGIRKFINSLTEITSGAGGFLDGITGILDGVRGSLEAYQSNLKAKTLLTIASAIAILVAAIVVLSLIDSEKLSTSLMAISVLFVELALVMKSLQKTFGRTKMAKISIMMVAMATAILILSFAMKKLASLDWEGVAKGTVGIAALAAVLVVAAKSLNKSSGKLIKGSTGLIAFAAAILIMSKAVESMSALSWEELAKGLTGLTVILAEVVAITHLMGDSKRMINKATGMVIMGAAMLIFAEAVKRMGKLSWEKIGKGLATMAGALTAITIAMKLLPKGMINKATGMVIMGAAMLIFAEAVERMGKLSWEKIGKGLATMAGALTAVTIAMKLLPKGMINKATGMVVMGAALLIIGEAVERMGKLSWEKIGKGLATLAGSLAAITLALNLMPKGMINKAIGLIGVAAAITILVKPLREMGRMSWEEIAKGLVALAGSMTILAVALNAMKKAIPGAAAMMIVAPALVIMAGVLETLGRMPLSEIGLGLLALAGVFVVLGAAALILKPLVPTIIGLGAAIALLGVGVAAVGLGVLAFATGLTALSVSATAAAGAIVIIGSSLLSLIPLFFEKIGEGLIALGNAIINGAPVIKDAFLVLLESALEAITEATPMISEAVFTLLDTLLDDLVEYTPGIVDKIFDFLIAILDAIAKRLPELIQAGVDVLMAFFSGVIDALSGIDVEVLLQGIAGIGLLSAIMIALSAVASFIPGAMIGVLGMGAVIAELALVLAAIGALAQIPGLKWLIDEGAEFMQSIGNAIGSFIGGIVGGFMEGVSSSFPQIGTDLSAFMTNVQPFIEGARNIDASTLDGVKALAEVILILTAANILDGLTSWLTGGSSLSGFADELVPFGRAMKAFSEEVSGMEGETVANAAIAGKTLAEMAATLPNTGGVLGFFAGENDMETFAQQLVPFGRAMKDFAYEVTGLDAGVVTEAAIAGKALAEMADTVPNSGGVVGFFAGENDMETFGQQLVPFGRAMKDFSFAVTGLNAEVITEAAIAGKALAEMADTVPNSGGVVGFFAGENDIEAFGEQLVPFGKAMKDYSVAVAGLDADVIVNSATAGKALAEMADTVPNTGGLVSWFTGDNDLLTFGEQLAPFGKSMKEYSMAVAGLDGDVIVNSANAAKSLAELADNIPNTGGIASWFSGDNDLASFGEKLVSFGESFAAYHSSISTVNTTKLSSIIAEFNKLVDMAKGVKNVDTKGMTNFSKDLTAIGDSGIDGFIGAFTKAYSKVENAATTMVAIFINGVNSKKTSIAKTFAEVVQIAIKEIKDHYDRFYSAGAYLVKGFANGIHDNTYLAEAKSRAMAFAALRAAKKTLEERSPSKAFYEVGDYAGLGFVNALDHYASIAYRAGSKMANSATNGLNATISAITDSLNGNMDMQPTIRPVLDLSNVSNGVGIMDGWLDTTRQFAVASSISSSRFNNGVYNQNGEVVDAISRLAKKMDRPSGDTITLGDITYDDGSGVSNAVKDLVRAVKMQRRT